MSINLKQLFDRCLEKWGLHAQFLMLVEESSELSVATLKCLRNLHGDDVYSHLAEEIADCQLMQEEIIYYLKDTEVFVSIINSDNLRERVKVSFFDAIIHYRKEKEKRLLKLLDAADA